MSDERGVALSMKEADLIPTDLSELSSFFGEVRRQLNSEVKRRRDLIKPIEQSLRALKDPHRNAVALYESTLALEKPVEELALPKNYARSVADLRALAEAKLSELEFTFARDLRAAFQEKGLTLEGPPHEMIADLFLIKVDMRKRQVHLTFSRQPVTRKSVKLDVDQVVSAYERARREIFERKVDLHELLAEVFEAYQRTLKLTGKPLGTRVSIVDCYRELVVVRQPLSFRKAPSKLSFVDYPKTHFIYDILQLRREHKLVHDGYRLNLGTATIEVGSDSTRAMFMATGATEGQFIKDIYFTAENEK